MSSACCIIVRRHIRRQNRRKLLIIRRHIRNSRDPFEETTEQQFVDLFRFPKQLCWEFLEKIKHLFYKNERQSAISITSRFLCALRYFATGNYQRVVGQDVMACMSQTSVHRCIHEVAEILNEIAHEYVTFPNELEQSTIKAEFHNVASFPGIVGLIDGTHIKITAPKYDLKYAYYCRKGGGYSINVLLVCDSKYLFRYANARFPGTSRDAYIWRRSAIQEFFKTQYAEGKSNCWLLGDGSFPHQPWLMTPCKTPSNRAMEKYNMAHETTRCMVQRCIGILKSRFRCLSSDGVLSFEPVKAGKIINACVVLHNILSKANTPIDLVTNEELETPSKDDQFSHSDEDDTLRQAQIIRHNLIETHFS